jgi:small GTP-binding protein
MVFINESIKEITLKLVYYGPGLCGKTTNLEHIHGNPKLSGKGKMISMSTETDRTLFFDFLPMDLGTVAGFRIRVQLYTVPGQVFYDATRRLVLKGADGVVFVVDSQKALLDASLESFQNLRDNLVINQIDPEKIPIILQYNKRDLPDVLPVEELDAHFNPEGKHSRFPAVAVRGDGVLATLQRAVQVMIASLAHRFPGAGKGEEKPAGPAAAPEAVSEPFPEEGPPAPPPPAVSAREQELERMMQMIYQSNENLTLLMNSLLEDVKQQQAFLKQFITRKEG